MRNMKLFMFAYWPDNYMHKRGFCTPGAITIRDRYYGFICYV